MTPGARLRELLAGEPFIAADCYNALTARIVEQVGFPAAYMGGHSTSMAAFGVPDYGVFTSTEMIEIAGRVAESIEIPLIADADELDESVASVHRAIRRYERAGIAGIHLEDEYHPKHSVWDSPLMPIADFQARIEAAVNARQSDDFVIMVRSNELQVANGGGTGSTEEMVRRAVAAKEAGADGFIANFAEEEQIKAIAAETDIPLGVYVTLLPGTQFALSTGWGTAAAVHVHTRIAKHIFETGEMPEDWGGDFDRRSLTGMTEYDEVIKRWAERTGRPVRELPF